MSDLRTTEQEASEEIKKQSGDRRELTPEELAELSGGVTVPSPGTDGVKLNHNQTWTLPD
jgi:hypothetical protein